MTQRTGQRTGVQKNRCEVQGRMMTTLTRPKTSTTLHVASEPGQRLDRVYVTIPTRIIALAAVPRTGLQNLSLIDNVRQQRPGSTVTP